MRTYSVLLQLVWFVFLSVWRLWSLLPASGKITAHQGDWQVLGWKVDRQTGKRAKPTPTSFLLSPGEMFSQYNWRKMMDGRLKLPLCDIFPSLCPNVFRWSRIIFFHKTSNKWYESNKNKVSYMKSVSQKWHNRFTNVKHPDAIWFYIYCTHNLTRGNPCI